MSELNHELNRTSYNIETPEHGGEFITTEKPVDTEKAAQLVRVARRKKYNDTRRAIMKAYVSGEIDSDRKNVLAETLNAAARSEIGKDVLREPKWENYKVTETVTWDSRPELTASILQQLPNGQILIIDSESTIRIWDENLLTELYRNPEIRVKAAAPLSNGRLLVSQFGSLVIIDRRNNKTTNIPIDTDSFTTDNLNKIYYNHENSGDIWCYDLSTNDDTELPLINADTIEKLVYHPSGVLALLDSLGSLQVYYLDSGETIDLEIKTRDFAIGPTGDVYIIEEVDQGGTFVRSLKRGESSFDEFPIISAPTANSTKISLSANGETVILSNGYYIKPYNIATGRRKKALTHDLERLIGRQGNDFIIADDNRIIGTTNGPHLTVWDEE